MAKSGRIAAGLLLVLAAIYAYSILQIQERLFTTDEVGPAAFPWFLTVLLVGFAALLLLGQGATPPAGGGGNATGESASGLKKALFAAFLLIAYVIALSFVGFLWSTPFFLALFAPLYQGGKLSRIVVLGTAVGFPIGLYFFLWHLFGVLLP
jgi:hypothetical protein